MKSNYRNFLFTPDRDAAVATGNLDSETLSRRPTRKATQAVRTTNVFVARQEARKV